MNNVLTDIALPHLDADSIAFRFVLQKEYEKTPERFSVFPAPFIYTVPVLYSININYE
ncbi:MAG: hypothetical protein IJ752_01000 [Alphaproteobacteria bacterium]|nr:hypothetical protein [Alphaproteobacteria bacterium]